jgi:hypothetical protein
MIADAIKVTYLDKNGEQKDGELHDSWVDSELSSRLRRVRKCSPLSDDIMMIKKVAAGERWRIFEMSSTVLLLTRSLLENDGESLKCLLQYCCYH